MVLLLFLVKDCVISARVCLRAFAAVHGFCSRAELCLFVFFVLFVCVCVQVPEDFRGEAELASAHLLVLEGEYRTICCSQTAQHKIMYDGVISTQVPLRVWCCPDCRSAATDGSRQIAAHNLLEKAMEQRRAAERQTRGARPFSLISRSLSLEYTGWYWTRRQGVPDGTKLEFIIFLSPIVSWRHSIAQGMLYGFVQKSKVQRTVTCCSDGNSLANLRRWRFSRLGAFHAAGLSFDRNDILVCMLKLPRYCKNIRCRMTYV